MHAICSEIMANLDCLHKTTTAFTTTSQWVYAATTQIIYRYDNKYILSDSHGRIYNMRDWDSLQVPALAYDSLVLMKPEQSCHMNWTLNLLVGIMKKKNSCFFIGFMLIYSFRHQYYSVTVTVWVRHDATEVI